MTPDPDTVAGLALIGVSLWWLVRGRPHPHDEAAVQQSRRRHPSSRPGSSTLLPPEGAAGPTADLPGRGTP